MSSYIEGFEDGVRATKAEYLKLLEEETHPAKTLTDEEIEDCFPDNGCSSTEDGFGLVVSAQFLHDFARAILRKAQEK